jgi:hypothetical protein
MSTPENFRGRHRAGGRARNRARNRAGKNFLIFFLNTYTKQGILGAPIE